jgi:uncharacterized protein (TIGR00369 family)
LFSGIRPEIQTIPLTERYGHSSAPGSTALTQKKFFLYNQSLFDKSERTTFPITTGFSKSFRENMMKKPNPEYIKRIYEIVNSCPYFELLSMTLKDVGVDYSVLEIDLAKKHLQPFGMVHGGVFASIIDAAAFWSIYFGIEDQSAGLTTVDLKLNYLAPAASGKLIARGRQIKVGKTLGYAEAEVTNETGKVLAHGTSTVIILPGKAIEGNPPLPSKFID